MITATCLTASAQFEPMPVNLNKAAVVDTARYKVTYNLKYKNHPADKEYRTDIRNVLVGNHSVADKSDIVQYFDSLRTITEKNGETTFNNITGTPWL